MRATHVMSGSNDLPTRKRMFEWIEKHEQTLYQPRLPIHPIGVYFSPATRNYFPGEFMRSYQGVVIQLLQAHREFQIVTPRTLAAFRGIDVDPAGRARGGRRRARGAQRAGVQGDTTDRHRDRCDGPCETIEQRPTSSRTLPEQDVRVDASSVSGDRYRAGRREAPHLLREFRRPRGRAERRADAAARRSCQRADDGRQ